MKLLLQNVGRQSDFTVLCARRSLQLPGCTTYGLLFLFFFMSRVLRYV
jgi:hypothetical protein